MLSICNLQSADKVKTVMFERISYLISSKQEAYLKGKNQVYRDGLSYTNSLTKKIKNTSHRTETRLESNEIL